MTLISVECGTLNQRRVFAEVLLPELKKHFYVAIFELSEPIRLLADFDEDPMPLLRSWKIAASKARIASEAILEARRTIQDCKARRSYIGRQIGLEHAWGGILRRRTSGVMAIVPDLFGDYLDLTHVHVDCRLDLKSAVESMYDQIEF